MVEVFVVAPVRFHRESLSSVLDESEELRVVGEAATINDAGSRLRDLRPDVAVVDASTRDGPDRPLLPPAEPDVKLVAVGVPDDDAVSWIAAGASGYVPRDASVNDVADAVARVARGELVTSREVTTHIVDRMRKLLTEVPDAAQEAGLTPRETEVLHLAAEGLPDKVIAQRLSIQVQTVKNHMQKILRKFGVRRRAEAAARMRRSTRESPDS
jgi:DNA-binding NarL/FixJ family response regulator